jgi:hypothetical protein
VDHSRETGSIATACLARGSSPLSPTTHSPADRDFPSPFKKPPMGGLRRARLVSVEGVSESRRCFGAFISARKIPFPGRRPRFLGTAGCLALPGPGLLVSALKIPFPGNGDFGSKRHGSPVVAIGISYLATSSPTCSFPINGRSLAHLHVHLNGRRLECRSTKNSCGGRLRSAAVA